jgi:hypothetical protein
MWTIRQQQADSLKQTALQKFEDEMVEHLKKFSPQHCKVAGEPAVREVIRIGIENASKYSFTNRGPLRFYIELMFMFGSYFDTDPQFPWAGAVLKDPEVVDQTIRADRLYAAMNKYLADVSGPDHQFLIEAMRRLSRLRIEDFLTPGPDLEEGILEKLRSVYPQRCEYLGEPVLRTMIRHGFKLADIHSLANDRGRVLMGGFAFAMGHGFAKDPLYGWVGRRLTKPKSSSAADRVEELYSKALLYLSRNQTLAKDHES